MTDTMQREIKCNHVVGRGGAWSGGTMEAIFHETPDMDDPDAIMIETECTVCGYKRVAQRVGLRAYVNPPILAFLEPFNA